MQSDRYCIAVFSTEHIHYLDLPSMITCNDIRSSFLDFFAQRGHRIVPSAPVIPHGDPTLLFTNAGMNQFKDVFLGIGKRDYTRAADTQKCIRVSGKHNDLEEVGRDTYHHTFFEMLGNWSFGDYFKDEAIAWSWELLVDVWKLDPQRLHATVFRSDDESFAIWKKYLPEDHIHRFDEKDNFWEMGDTGPCGPCTEIHYDHTPDLSGANLVNAGDARVVEIWNNVFIQYNRTPDGELQELPSKHVDTGMGLERIAAVLQGVQSNYDIDIFRTIIAQTEQLCGRPYRSALDSPDGIAMRVIADHIRTLSFAIADGAIPGNEGRGYVLRRILRRAARYARTLDFTEPVLWQHVDVLVGVMGDAFPELRTNSELIKKVIKAEEEQFLVTLDNGRSELLQAWRSVVTANLSHTGRRVENSLHPNQPITVIGTEGEERTFANARELALAMPASVIPGEIAFKLYDTFGFPVDLTELIATEEYGMNVDHQGFQKLLLEQKNRSRAARKTHVQEVQTTDLGVTTVFTGYTESETESPVVYVDRNQVVVQATPLYVEMGGQVSDTGLLTVGGTTYSVEDVRNVGGAIVHFCESDVDARVGDMAITKVDRNRRSDIEREHSATHLLHEALRRVLGSHVQQAGSLVAPDHLRFDFSHYERVQESDLRAIEQLVNDKIFENITVVTEELPTKTARTIPNVKMFFGDKYGDTVRVVFIDPDFSVEFCGGTHVSNTSQIGMFKIVSEGSVAAGVRRIEAIAGRTVPTWIQKQLVQIADLTEEKERLLDRIRQLDKELLANRTEQLKRTIPTVMANAQYVDGIRLVVSRIDVEDMDQLKSLGDELRSQLRSNGIGVLGSVTDGKVLLVCVVTDDVTHRYSAGTLVSRIAKQLGGGGGGKAHLATAGGKDANKLDDVLANVAKLLADR